MVTKTDLLLKGTEVDTTIPKRYNFYEGAMELLKGGSLNLFLIAAPVAFLSKYFHWYDSFTFCCALLAIAPFAERLGYITEQISLHTSDTVGGLLNATFGNATELIISIAALNKGYYRVVQLSLLGSVLSNLLLVLGSALFLGGLKYKYQKFNKMDSSVNSTLLVFAASATLLPTIIASSQQISVENGLTLSRVIAIIALMVYIAFLYFQISTHADMDDTPFLEDTKKILQKIIGAKVLSLSKIRDGGSGSGGSSSSGKMVKLSEDRMKSMKQGRVGEGGDTDDELLVKGGHQNDVLHNGIDRGDDDDSLDDISQFSNDDSDLEDNDDDEDDEEDVLGVTYSIFWLAVVTIFISVLSDIVVDTIEVAALDLKVPKLFIAAIIVPIIGTHFSRISESLNLIHIQAFYNEHFLPVYQIYFNIDDTGNAAEHASAIVFAMKNKLNITLGVAVGSSCQISLMVLPLLVTIGWAVDRPMSMNLGIRLFIPIRPSRRYMKCIMKYLTSFFFSHLLCSTIDP